ncbi:MAG: glutamate ligase domain-containing protein, partial [Gemmatimonadales bacterium]
RDHMKYLGDSLELIACEKAGIAKPGVPFVVGEKDPRLVEVLRREAKQSVGKAVGRSGGQKSADVRVLPADYEWCGPLSLGGPHQRRNAAVAYGILCALPAPYRPGQAQIEHAFGTAKIPGRLDRRGRWLFDVAHNPDGMRALVAALAVLRPARPIHALVSILGDKEWPDMLVQLDQAIDRGVLTIAPTAAVRGWDIDWLTRWLRDPSRPPPHAQWTLVPDFREAMDKVQEGAGTILVTGSFHTVGDVMQALGMDV